MKNDSNESERKDFVESAIAYIEKQTAVLTRTPAHAALSTFALVLIGVLAKVIAFIFPLLLVVGLLSTLLLLIAAGITRNDWSNL